MVDNVSNENDAQYKFSAVFKDLFPWILAFLLRFFVFKVRKYIVSITITIKSIFLYLQKRWQERERTVQNRTLSDSSLEILSV